MPIVIAGATGNLGGRIARELLERDAVVRAIVRADSPIEKLNGLRAAGIETVTADFSNAHALAAACEGASCVVSALSGLDEVIVDAQTALLHAAETAGVRRFIPSDFAIDYTRMPGGNNRNLDLRRKFRERLDQSPISATSIFCGMFTELLTGAAPVILFPLKRVMYWENPDQLMDFTTVQDTASYTAAAAVDDDTPRDLRIAGDVISARGMAEAASDVTGSRFKLMRAGSLQRLDRIIRFTQWVAPGRDAIYPPWQGMQYLRDMFSGKPKLQPLDTGRYGGIHWTTVRDVIAASQS